MVGQSLCFFEKKSNNRYNNEKANLMKLAKAQHPGQEYD
ncbi:hypothetical protein BN2497_2167 [Janthinobacterium sp. CG23_2]|nr:hypothetical protein BN2497_2167 [Janthinobacterium sp. CG23_2]CUU27481.1 hypothetical protein BN3177_2167 [Janthinobacterium sp. CG23_2]